MAFDLGLYFIHLDVLVKIFETLIALLRLIRAVTALGQFITTHGSFLLID